MLAPTLAPTLAQFLHNILIKQKIVFPVRLNFMFPLFGLTL